MFIDNNLMFHDDTVIAAATEYKGDSLPLHTANEMSREGRGEGLEVIVLITGAFTGGTNVKFEVVTAPEASLATDEVHYGTQPVVTAELTVGRKFRLPLGMVSEDTASYFGLMATSVGVHAPDADNPCTFSAWIQRVGEDQNSFDA